LNINREKREFGENMRGYLRSDTQKKFRICRERFYAELCETIEYIQKKLSRKEKKKKIQIHQTKFV